jgi:diaminopimelate epimerase
MQTAFLKMHGAGNDFIVVDERAAPLGLTPARIAALSNRRTGIGCDQFIVIGRAPGVDATMGIYNPDGGEAGACGNATRCVAEILFAETGARAQTIRTIAGNLQAEILPNGLVSVDMGPVRLGWQDIPLAAAMDTLHLDLPGDPAAASMGNPHITFFDTPVDQVTEIGPGMETNPLFPQHVNVGFAQILAPDRMRLRVWERAAGLTMACGSGACAALVNAHRRGLTGRHATIIVDGGVLEITWRADGHVLMTGPVATAYQGTVDLSAYAA